MGRSSKRNRQQTRDTSAIANYQLRSAISQRFGFRTLGVLEDRRVFHFMGRNRPIVSTTASARRLVSRQALTRRQGPLKNFSGLRPESGRWVTAFRDPPSVLLCVRRKQRREVMFARGKTGRGGQRRPRFNRFSRISCRR